MLKIFPIILIVAGIAVVAGGFGVSSHSIDGANVMKILSHCDGVKDGEIKTPDAPEQKREKSGSGGGLFGAISDGIKEVFGGVEESVRKKLELEGKLKPYICAEAKKDLAELKAETRALIKQIHGYIRLLGWGVALYGITMILIGASNLAAVWRK